ncbi:MAG: hypothetical protein E7455_05355 [Ruminococcaceae bacterium]|nr:hypothetical protein [Oscillospiraceae bacterium]
MECRWKIALILAVAWTLCGCAGEKTTEVAAFQTNPTRVTHVAPASVAFPVTLPDSGLIAEELRQYRGAYWEDGSGDYVEDVAALMICNPTDRMIAFASFTVDTPTGKLYFFAYRLPPKSRCLVLEYNRKSCDPQKVLDCRELTVRWDTQELSREEVHYVGFGSAMTIVNQHSRELENITVWYKQYVASENYYLGGAAYSAHLFGLQPGQQRTVTPEHYDAAHSRIVAIELQ